MFLTRIQAEKIFVTIPRCSPDQATVTSHIGLPVGIVFMEVSFVLHGTPHTPRCPHLSGQNDDLSVQNETLSMKNETLSVQSRCENGSFCTLLQNEIFIHFIKSIGLTA